MNSWMIVSIVASCVLLFGCRTSESIDKKSVSAPSPRIDSADSVALPPPGQVLTPTVVKQNSSRISAIVDSVIILDQFQYRLFATVRMAEQRNGSASLAEARQSLELRPVYQLTGAGVPDMGNEQNAGILRLRNAHPGDAFAGVVSYSADGGWVISRADSAQSIH